MKGSVMIAMISLAVGVGINCEPGTPPSPDQIAAKPKASDMKNGSFRALNVTQHDGATIHRGAGTCIAEINPRAYDFNLQIDKGGAVGNVGLHEIHVEGTEFRQEDKLDWSMTNSPRVLRGQSRYSYQGQDDVLSKKAWHIVARDKGWVYEEWIHPNGHLVKFRLIEGDALSFDCLLREDTVNRSDKIKRPVASPRPRASATATLSLPIRTQ